MNKDVIYIDVEDDITAIVGKVKTSKEKVVALVPPKRVGVLQSAVNLRLLSRAAKQSNKRLALVTNNHSLIALAAAASIPVAKNLQSKPELAEIPALAVDDDDDIIDGGKLPIGEHAKQTESSTDDESAAMVAALAQAPKTGETPAKPRVKKGAKVPNFNRFRKKMVLIVAGALLLIGFLVWAIFFAPRATVVISAKTTSSAINIPVKISTTKETNFEEGILKATVAKFSEEKNVEFEATGKKDAGEKATGTVEFSRQAVDSATVPAGTKLKTSGGLVFVTNETVTIPASSTSFPDCFPTACPGTASVGVTAAENGSKYNAASGSLSGAPSGASASFTGPTSGGVTKMVTVVSQADVQKAKEQIADEQSDEAKESLKAKFTNNQIILDESLDTQYDDVKVSPEVGEEADNATLSTEVTYQLSAVSRDEIGAFIDSYMKDELDSREDQRVYDNGKDKAVFENESSEKDTTQATLVATAQVGPRIDDAEVKEQARGKRYGEIQQSLEAIQGIDAVDVKFFPFWISSVPDDINRITVEFKLDESR